jgi:hypothetical protein
MPKTYSMKLFKTLPELPDVSRPFAEFLVHSAWISDLNDSKGNFTKVVISPSIDLVGMEILFSFKF